MQMPAHTHETSIYNLLTMVSHELRTPLMAILGYADLISMDAISDPKELKRCVQVIQQSAVSQVQVIDDLLDASSILLNHLNLKMIPVDLVLSGAQAVAAIRPEAERRSIQIEFVTKATLSTVLADALRLEQIFQSLLSNAVKFSNPSGAVKVSIESTERSLVVQVLDQGIGLTAENQKRIFEPFVQADSSLTRKYGGLGVGLAITKYLVEAHGGTISIHSEGLGFGTEALFTIPLLR